MDKRTQTGRVGRRPNRAIALVAFVTGLTLAGVGLAAAQTPTAALVKDINPGNSHSSPDYLADVNGTLFFAADDGVNGKELWKSDGTAAGTTLVKDIYPGTESGFPSDLANVDGTLYFRAIDGTNGSELWKSDGTSAGTTMVKDIAPGLDWSFPLSLTNVNGTLFFAAAEDGLHGFELWKSDGTPDGTTLVKDIDPDSGSSLGQFTTVSGSLFFTAEDGTHGSELWTSDGTPDGTTLVEDIRPGGATSHPLFLTNVNGTLFFAAEDGTNGIELWKSNGTPDGTTLVEDIQPGAESGAPSGLANVEGSLFFAANDGTVGVELWKSDGTAAGTSLVKNIRPGVEDSIPFGLTNVDGTLFFTARDSAYGETADGIELGNTELWKSDGTPAGTTLVKDIQPGVEGSDPTQLTNVDGVLFFEAFDETNGRELWSSDGTPDGTALVADIKPGADSGGASGLTNVSDTLFFRAADGTNGVELWRGFEIAAPPDTSGDGVPGTPPDGALVPEVSDACPTSSGSASNDGCPPPASKADRTLTLDASKSKVNQDEKVRFSGRIDAAADGAECEGGQMVELQRRRRASRPFKSFASDMTNAAGHYAIALESRKRTRTYRARVGESTACSGSRSNPVKVRVEE